MKPLLVHTRDGTSWKICSSSQNALWKILARAELSQNKLEKFSSSWATKISAPAKTNQKHFYQICIFWPEIQIKTNCYGIVGKDEFFCVKKHEKSKVKYLQFSSILRALLGLWSLRTTGFWARAKSSQQKTSSSEPNTNQQTMSSQNNLVRGSFHPYFLLSYNAFIIASC